MLLPRDYRKDQIFSIKRQWMLSLNITKSVAHHRGLIGEGYNQRLALGVVKPGRGIEGDEHFDGPRQDGDQEEGEEKTEPQ